MHADTSHKNGQRGEQNLVDLGVRRRESRKKEVKGGFLYPWERGERGKSDNESRCTVQTWGNIGGKKRK